MELHRYLGKYRGKHSDLGFNPGRPGKEPVKHYIICNGKVVGYTFKGVIYNYVCKYEPSDLTQDGRNSN